MSRFRFSIPSLLLLVGAFAALVGLWSFWPFRSEADALTGEEDATDVWGSGKKPPTTVPDAAWGTRPALWMPSGVGGGPISEKVEENINSRVTALEPTLAAAARHFSVPTDLLAVTIQRESAGNIEAKGDMGESLGLGQIQADTQDTINRYWGTDLDRTNWVHNIYLTAANLRRGYDQYDATWWPDYSWYHAMRVHLCGLKGAEDKPSCGDQEAAHRLANAGLESQIP